MIEEVTLGARYENGITQFRVWAPFANNVKLHIVSPYNQYFSMQSESCGYYHCNVKDIYPGYLYFYTLDNIDYPDPTSYYQPQGVFGPSEVIDFNKYKWSDQEWYGLPLDEYIIYETHIGTYTKSGTLIDLQNSLDRLVELGITAVELMPLAQFSGKRNWGYDGVFLYALQQSYGNPIELQALVDACHQRGLAVILDVVYNHVGPEGNVLPQFAPYFTDFYQTAWGSALNFDGPDSDEVRRFFIENALMWINDYHIDALRLDALHAIYDRSAVPFLQELADTVHAYAKKVNRKIYLIAESTLNDTKLILPKKLGGFGLDAQWNDDFHHALHTLLTKENNGYYKDFGKFNDLVKAYREGFVYSGQYSKYRKCRHGHSSKKIEASQFIVFSQNHDQVGNRIHSERLSQIVNFDQLKISAALVLLSPYIPLIFMGEEYGEKSPFYYFTDHSSKEIINAVRQGRQAEFADFEYNKTIKDPQNKSTFLQSKLNFQLQTKNMHRILFKLYKQLIYVRKNTLALRYLCKKKMKILKVDNNLKIMIISRSYQADEVIIIYSLNEQASQITLPNHQGNWQKMLDLADKKWGGNGSKLTKSLQFMDHQSINLLAYQAAVYRKSKVM